MKTTMPTTKTTTKNNHGDDGIKDQLRTEANALPLTHLHFVTKKLTTRREGASAMLTSCEGGASLDASAAKALKTRRRRRRYRRGRHQSHLATTAVSRWQLWKVDVDATVSDATATPSEVDVNVDATFLQIIC